MQFKGRVIAGGVTHTVCFQRGKRHSSQDDKDLKGRNDGICISTVFTKGEVVRVAVIFPLRLGF
jgi:hypothetical protein